jgi:hypothetical protein
MLLVFFSEDLKERFQNIAHIMLRAMKKNGPSYSTTKNCTPHSHFLGMKWDIMWGFSVP